MRRQLGIRSIYQIAYLFMIGLFLGILFVNLGYETWISNGSLLGPEMVNRLKNSRPAGEGLLGYILRHRLSTGCFLCLVSMTLMGMPVLCAYIAYMGIAAGCLLSVAVVRYGIRGLLLMAAVLFPQALLLVPAYVLLLFWAVDVNRTFYAPKTQIEGYERYSRRYYIKKTAQIIGIMAVVIIGCLLESYVNPNVLHYVLKIF